MVASDLDDVSRHSCSLEYFKEAEEVISMINNLKNIYNDKNLLESQYDKLYNILKQYYEQPNLLDPHLEKILNKFVNILRDESSTTELKHATFDYMYQIVKIRGYKIVVRHLPHEISDLQPVLTFLESQDVKNLATWRSRYVLLMWLSIISIMPFHMARLDGFQPGEKDEHGNLKKTVMRRIFNICKTYVAVADACQEAGAFLTSKFLTRSDVKDMYLVNYLDWSKNENELKGTQHGVLAALAAVLKRGRREDLLPHASSLLSWIIEKKYADSEAITVRKFSMKLIQRIALLFLKPRLAKWRYTRGCRSLAMNLQMPQSATAIITNQGVGDTAGENNENDDDDADVPEEVEECCGRLLMNLGDASSEVRWSAAKGAARVAGRLPMAAAADVASSVLEAMHSSNACSRHGGCLGAAELARRGLLPAGELLGAALRGALAALARDEEAPGGGGGGAGGAGAARDAACHVAWATARAYDAAALAPYALELAAALAATAVFDREINCRRAAAAAFQENVGRHGLFPCGIEVLTLADYRFVGPRVGAFLRVAPRLARLQPYALPLARHLIEHKIMHWDGSVRDLASKALGLVVAAEAEAGGNAAAAKAASAALPALVAAAGGGRGSPADPRSRHGAALAAARTATALSQYAPQLLTQEVISNLADLIQTMGMNGCYRGLGADLMRSAACDVITSLAESTIHFGDKPVIEYWINASEEWMCAESATARSAATSALAAAARRGGPSHEAVGPLVQRLIVCLNTLALTPDAQMMRAGAATALSKLPPPVIAAHFQKVVVALCESASITPNTALWAESRRDSIRALTSIIVNSDSTKMDPTYKFNALCTALEALVGGLQDYTQERRGDTGAWVREAAAVGLRMVLPRAVALASSDSSFKIIAPIAASAITLLLQQAVQRIDRTRALSARAFVSLLHNDPKIPGIPCLEELLELFPKNIYEDELQHALPQSNKDTDIEDTLSPDSDEMDTSDEKGIGGTASVLWLFPSHTMPLFVRLLKFQEYRYHLLLGLSASAGDLTESLVKHTTGALWNQLWQLEEQDVSDVCNTLTKVFMDHLKVDRVTVPMLRFLDRLLGSGCVNTVVEDHSSTFADDILNLVKNEVTGNKSIYKLLDAINVLCQLVQILDTYEEIHDDGVSSKFTGVAARALSKLLIWLCGSQRYTRRAAAARIYEALAARGATDFNRVEALSILAAEDWEREPAVVRPVRDRLADLLGVPKPVPLRKT